MIDPQILRHLSAKLAASAVGGRVTLLGFTCLDTALRCVAGPRIIKQAHKTRGLAIQTGKNARNIQACLDHSFQAAGDRGSIPLSKRLTTTEKT